MVYKKRVRSEGLCARNCTHSTLIIKEDLKRPCLHVWRHVSYRACFAESAKRKNVMSVSACPVVHLFKLQTRCMNSDETWYQLQEAKRYPHLFKCICVERPMNITKKTPYRAFLLFRTVNTSHKRYCLTFQGEDSGPLGPYRHVTSQ